MPSTLYALVQEQGVLNTTVTLTGSSQVALARNPRPRGGNTAVARRAPQPQYEQQYDNAGDPVVITPQGQRAYPQAGYPQAGYPQARADDGYIYPADGSSTEQRYPSPRRVYGAQAYPQAAILLWRQRHLSAGAAGRLLPAAAAAVLPAARAVRLRIEPVASASRARPYSSSPLRSRRQSAPRILE